jgi:hypothetical protein
MGEIPGDSSSDRPGGGARAAAATGALARSAQKCEERPSRAPMVAQQGDVTTTEKATSEGEGPTADAALPDESSQPDPPDPPEAGADPRSDQRPMHWVRGPLVTVLGCLLPFCTMAYEDRWRLSVPVGFIGCLVATWGILDWLGTFDEPEEHVVHRTNLKTLTRPLIEVLLSVLATIGALTVAVAGVLPAPIGGAALLVPVTFLWSVISVFRLGQALGAWNAPNGEPTPLGHRYGFWLVVLVTVLYLPLLGSYSLSDPWETHYGEVAREMLARNDWISTWWAQDTWFWSKPVFDVGVQALSFSLLGVRYMPDEMLRTAELGHFPEPEWAARMPVFLITLIGAYLL